MSCQLTKVSACTLAENKPCLDNRRERTFSFGELVKWHTTSLISLVTGSIFTKRPAWHRTRYTREWSTNNQRQPEHCSRTSNLVMARRALPKRVGIQWQRPCLFARACVLHHPDLHIFPTQPLASQRFVWHQLKNMYIYESSYIHGKEQRYWNEDRDSNPKTSSVGPLDSPQLYWGADRNRKTGITNITLVKGHCTDRPAASRTACFTKKMQTDCRYIMYELEPLYE